MNELQIKDFWNSHPCGDEMAGSLESFNRDYLAFFDNYDSFRYGLESHIPRCLDQLDLRGKRVLEIGLGQGADSEQLIRRGAVWTGLDLTPEAVERVRTRMSVKGLPFEDIRQGSALSMPFADSSFDLVYSHGVLHHIPDVRAAQSEIKRVLKPEGELVAMLYAKWSLNYLLSIAVVRRLALVLMVGLGIKGSGKSAIHVDNAKKEGLFSYLRMSNFVHRNTDGPLNPYAKVYDIDLVREDFKSFTVIRSHREFMYAPPLPVAWMPFAKFLGWHLWVHLSPKAKEFS